MNIIKKLKVKRGNVYAKSLASQSYFYRLGYLWINTLMIEDKRCTPINPFKWSFVDILWIIYFLMMSQLLLAFVALFGWFKAYSMKDVTPVKFNCGGRYGFQWSTDYTHQNDWYYDNGKIEVE